MIEVMQCGDIWLKISVFNLFVSLFSSLFTLRHHTRTQIYLHCYPRTHSLSVGCADRNIAQSNLQPSSAWRPLSIIYYTHSSSSVICRWDEGEPRPVGPGVEKFAVASRFLGLLVRPRFLFCSPCGWGTLLKNLSSCHLLSLSAVLGTWRNCLWMSWVKEWQVAPLYLEQFAQELL
jgi:hypothetical protein